MPDSKLTALPKISTASPVDLIYLAHDPSGSSVPVAISASNLFLSIPSGGIVIGGDTNLYRYDATTLKTDDNFVTSGSLQTTGGVISGNGILYLNRDGSKLYFGNYNDAILYRTGSNQLKTDGNFTIGGSALTLSNSGTPTIYFGDTNDVNLYRSAANTLATDDSLIIAQGNVKINTYITVGDTSLTGNAGDVTYVAGNLRPYRNSTQYTAYAYVPLLTAASSTSWDGDSYSTTAKTLIDLSSVFGLPAGIKAIYARIIARDSSGSANASIYFILDGTNTATIGSLGARPSGLPNDFWADNCGMVACDSNGDIYYQIAASGSNTMDCWIQIWGYFI